MGAEYQQYRIILVNRKRGIIRQYHSVSDQHLPKYIDEFCFKHNNRRFDVMFETLVFNSILPPDFTPKEVDSKMINVRMSKKRARLTV